MPPQKETTMSTDFLIFLFGVCFGSLTTLAVTQVYIAHYPTVVGFALHHIYEGIAVLERWEWWHFKTERIHRATFNISVNILLNKHYQASPHHPMNAGFTDADIPECLLDFGQHDTDTSDDDDDDDDFALAVWVDPFDDHSDCRCEGGSGLHADCYDYFVADFHNTEPELLGLPSE